MIENISIACDAAFGAGSENFGTITGNVTFQDGSANSGTVNGNATFQGTAENKAGATVTGDATFNGTSVNAGAVGGDAMFAAGTTNSGAVTGSVSTFTGWVGQNYYEESQLKFASNGLIYEREGATHLFTSFSGNAVSAEAEIGSDLLTHEEVEYIGSLSSSGRSEIYLNGTSNPALWSWDDIVGQSRYFYIPAYQFKQIPYPVFFGGATLRFDGKTMGDILQWHLNSSGQPDLHLFPKEVWADYIRTSAPMGQYGYSQILFANFGDPNGYIFSQAGEPLTGNYQVGITSVQDAWPQVDDGNGNMIDDPSWTPTYHDEPVYADFVDGFKQ